MGICDWDSVNLPTPSVTIAGTIQLEDVRQPAQDVTVYVRVEEASRADAPASRIAEVVLRGVQVFPGLPPIPFTIPDVLSVPSGRYLVRVHADVDGDGRVTRGDYISVQSYPVLTSADSDNVAIVVHEVR
jgi:uncharacterized lipoprotein YbaY